MLFSNSDGRVPLITVYSVSSKCAVHKFSLFVHIHSMKMNIQSSPQLREFVLILPYLIRGVDGSSFRIHVVELPNGVT